MTFEAIIEKILSSRKDLKREDVLKMIEGKERSAKGYLTSESAARVVASELGILNSGKISQPRILIKDLVSGLNDVTVTGRVVHVSPIQSFTRPNGELGTVRRILIADKSGTLKVVLWNEEGKLKGGKEIIPGEIVRFSHGYVREGLDGKQELNIGLRGIVEISPSDLIGDRYPPLRYFMKKISEITGENRRVDVLGVVQRLSSVTRFIRQDGLEGKVRSLWLRDTSGEMRVVFWDEKVEEIKNLKDGNYLEIIGARVKERIDGQLELHVNDSVYVKVLTEKPMDFELPDRLFKIKDLKHGMNDVNILARVAHVGRIREFNRANGGTGYFSPLLIKDETGSVQLNLWDDKAELSKEITQGDVVLIKKAYVRRNRGRNFLNIDKKGSLVLNPDLKEAERLPQHRDIITKIKDLGGIEKDYVTVEGTVLTPPKIMEVTTKRNEKVKVASFKLDDGTGRVEVSLWRELAEEAEDLSVEDRVRIRNANVKRDFSGKPKLSSDVLTYLENLSGKSNTQRINDFELDSL